MYMVKQMRKGYRKEAEDKIIMCTKVTINYKFKNYEKCNNISAGI